MRLLLVTAGLAILAGCGYPGPPMPPALYVPDAISDLKSEVIGDKIIVRFTTPLLTGERLPVTMLRSIELKIGPGEADFSRDQWAATATAYMVPADKLGPREVEIPVSDWAGKVVIVGVRTTGQSGRVSEWSNPDILAVSAPLAKPRLETPKATAKGVALAWSGDAPNYRVLRAELGAEEVTFETAGETDAREFVDANTEFGAKYRYVVIGLSGAAQESLPSDPMDIQPIDTFAPSVPASPAAVAGVASIDLSWGQNIEDDFGGFNVYRSVDDGPFTLYAEKIGVPAFTDSKVEAGKRYRYTVTAVDKAGNQSAPSAEASARIE